MEIFLVRHGESVGNHLGRVIGWSDHALTARGRAQAGAAAARLAPLGPMPVLCSDLRRARETGAVIAARWGGDIATDARWREISCGQFEDATWDEFNREPGLLAQLEREPMDTCIPGGESAAMLVARVTEGLAALLARPEPAIVVVTHDGPIRAVLMHCLQIAPTRFWAVETSHGGITRLRATGEWISVCAVNDTAHLAEIV